MKIKNGNVKVNVLKITLNESGRSAILKCKTSRKDSDGKWHDSYFTFLAVGKSALGKSVSISEKLKEVEKWENGDAKTPIVVFLEDFEITAEPFSNREGKLDYPIRFKVFSFSGDEAIPELVEMAGQPIDEDEFPF